MKNASSSYLSTIGWIAVLLTCLQVQQALAKPLSFFAKRRFEERYRQILSRYAEGETENALELMMSLEGEVIAGDYSLQESVRRVEISVAKSLADRSVDALEAVVVFHESLYRRYREDGNPAAAGHARATMVALVLEFSLMKSVDAEAGEVARFVVRQGKEMLASHAETMAMSLFERAVEIDPEEVSPWLCLAWIHEKRGRYEESLGPLRSLIDIEPENREGRLRLAIHWSRQSRDLEASSLLDGLASAAPNDWIRVLAVQEMARILADSGELESALQLISGARKDVPCENSLAVQYAYLTERAGGWPQGLSLDETLRRCAGTVASSPRDVYNRLPSSCRPSPPEEDVSRSLLHLKTTLAAIR